MDRLDLHGDPLGGERFDDPPPLPVAAGVLLEMLERAAATSAEMAADRRAALGRGVQHLQEPSACARDLHQHPLARESIGDVDRPAGRLGDAVALRAEAGYAEFLRHWLGYLT